MNETPNDGVPLSDSDYDNYFLLLMVAGNETTRHAISHSMLALANNKDQFQLLKERPGADRRGAWRNSSDGRRRSTSSAARRCATSSYTARQIHDGDKVVMWFTAANRDETVFEDPYRFYVTRSPNEHVTFGKGGPHFCLGAWLARLELRVMFEELLARIDDIELTGTVLPRALELHQRHQVAARPRLGSPRRRRDATRSSSSTTPTRASGLLEDPLRDAGAELDIRFAGTDPFDRRPRRPDRPAGHRQPAGPHRGRRGDPIEPGRRTGPGAPVLGICLGAELLAEAAGASPSLPAEYGYRPVSLTDEGTPTHC